ncbi:unnamed protein product [Microthlaspi erraticum]|uniref:Uncharacterized protein n=1 Tax=Microthlaspi erraticum TaxID=1685480 RepID=A0A6D2L9P6_9BRAS|nr:unnamed protein product [Microthlaspi erraticum]
MFGMEVFCTFPSNYVEAQKHGNERRIKIGDEDETLRTGKRTKPSGRGNVHWSNLVLSQSSGDTSYLEKIRMIITNMEKTCSYYNGAKTIQPIKNGRIKWRYTAASKTGQSCSNIQLLNEDEASLNQLGNDTSCYGGERAWINSKNT